MDILKSHKLLAAAAIVLPGMIQITTAMQIAFNCSEYTWLFDGALVIFGRHKHMFVLKDAVPAEAQQPDPPSAETYSALPTRLLDNIGTQTVPSSAPTQIQLDSCDPEPTSEPSQRNTCFHVSQWRECSQTYPPLGFSSISYNDLIKITDGFNDRPVSEGGCRLGEGGFGTVYKGVLNHKLVAVKKLIPVSDKCFLSPTLEFCDSEWDVIQVEDMSLEDLKIQFHQEIQTLTV